MRQFVIASLLAAAVLAAPAAHAGVGVSTDTTRPGWSASSADEALAAATLQRPSERNGLTGWSNPFAPSDDQAAIEQAKGAEASVAIGSPLRRSVMVRAEREKVATLPEPATWVMLLLGFGAMGAALRWKLRRSEARFNAKIRRIEAGESA